MTEIKISDLYERCEALLNAIHPITYFIRMYDKPCLETDVGLIEYEFESESDLVTIDEEGIITIDNKPYYAFNYQILSKEYLLNE